MAPRRFQPSSLRKKLRIERRARASNSVDVEKQKVLDEERLKTLERLGEVLFADAKVFEKVPRSVPWIEHVASKIVAHSKQLPKPWLCPGSKDDEILQTAIDVVSIAMEAGCDTSARDIAVKLPSSPYKVTDADFATKSCLQAVFASVGALTMAYDPGPPGTESTKFFSILSPKTKVQQCAQEDGVRRLPGFLQSFDDFIPRLNNDPGIEIMKSELDCYTLSRIARIKIKWTDLITMHLHYEETSNELLLFRYPVFCLLNLQREDQICFFSSLFPTKLNKTEKNPRILNRSQTLMREVLLSYYLLFGHDSRSSKLYRSRLRPKLLGESHCDPWLDDVCSSGEWDLPMHNSSMLQSKSIYNTSSDFVLLGPRLVRLKTYCDAQQSRKFWDFWRDRRNPFNFYTFWAVIVIGVLSLFFSVAQSALSAAQLRFAINQGRM